MRLNGVNAANYYGPAAGGMNQQPPPAANITASGSASQNASGNASILVNPGLGVIGIFVLGLLILHYGGIRRSGE